MEQPSGAGAQERWHHQNQNQNSFNVPQTGKFVCHSSDRKFQKQKHITRTGTIAEISNTILNGIKKIDI